MEESNNNKQQVSESDNNNNNNNNNAGSSKHVSSVTDHVSEGGGGGSAKYKLMSPAKLPISSRTTSNTNSSNCITVPPGLSPTSFLDSPVLLSNIKAEPSPTTGSFFKSQLMQASGEIAAFSQEKPRSSYNNSNERTSSSFEFRFHTGASSTSGLSSAGLVIPARLSRNEAVNHQDQRYSQSAAPPSLASHYAAVVLHDSSVRSTTNEPHQGGQTDTSIQSTSSDRKETFSSVPAERTSEDGYNWRKYGQKLVRGSEFPRSYYKCTYPNCEVKKIFERSPSGQITEIVYKGSHEHAKPQAARRNNPGALLSIQEDKLDKDFSFNGQDDKLNTNSMEQNGSPALSPLQANEDGVDGSGTQFLNNDDVEEDDPSLKRRKMEDGFDATPIIKPIREPRVVVQTVSEVDILDDGYRWRKYGQKVVRGNPNPRSYYKCTNAGCPVRKHVERASHDPKAVITTYEGKHNHDVPTAKHSNHEFARTAPYVGASKMTRPQEQPGSVSLDLGVGIGRDGEATRGQIDSHNPAMMVAQSSQMTACYGIVNGGLMNPYGNRENRVEGHSFPPQPVHPSNQCPQNLGRILMGP